MSASLDCPQQPLTPQYILGCWYRDDELGKRTAVFTSAAQFGSFFSGIMQGSIKTTLDGRLGHSGWQWLFVSLQSPA